MTSKGTLMSQQMYKGTKDILTSSKDLFVPQISRPQSPAVKFALSLEQVVESAPNTLPQLEISLNKSIDMVRNFIKNASNKFGRISYALETI